MKIHLLDKYARYLKGHNQIKNIKIEHIRGSIYFDFKLDSITYTIEFREVQKYKLPTVLISSKERDLSNIPHLQVINNRNQMYACLSTRDDAVVSKKGEKGAIYYLLQRITTLMRMSKYQIDREYKNEFLYYWEAKSTFKYFLYIKDINKMLELQVFRVYGESDNKDVIIDGSLKLNDKFRCDSVKLNYHAVYVPLVNIMDIAHLTNQNMYKYLNDLIMRNISGDNIEQLESITIKSKKLLLICSIQLHNTIPFYFGFDINFNSAPNTNIYDIIKDTSIRGEFTIRAIKVKRSDIGYLFSRCGVNDTISEENILCIGAGSLGSYILRELPKMGIKNISIFDNDKMSMDNVIRHTLGTNNIDTKKSDSMKSFLESIHFEVNVQSNNVFLDINNINRGNLSKYSLIIVSTGGTDYMMRLNLYFNKNKINVPILYTWIEKGGKGVHTLLVDYTKKGCFKCLYDKDNENKLHFSNNKDVNTIIDGCGGVINPYGNLVLVKGSAMILEIIYNIIYKNYNYKENQAFSLNTDIGKQNCCNEILIHKSIINRGCDICGD